MGTDEPSFRVLAIAEEEPVLTEGGSLQWVPMRRRLGIGAFGINAFRAPHEGDSVVEDHVESPGQEEVYLVVSGRVRFTIDGEQIDAGAGTAVFVPRPDVRRSGIALDSDTAVVAVGGWRDKPYHSLPWEPIYLAQEAMLREDWAEAAETLEREAGEHRDTGIVQFRLACCHAQMGELDQAMNELQHAVEAAPGIRDRVASEKLLSPLREHADWARVIG